MIGTATFIRETDQKEKHKGRIYGVYVTSSQRRKSVGQALIAAVLNQVKEDPSLEQFFSWWG